jgi:hypothetical protein
MLPKNCDYVKLIININYTCMIDFAVAYNSHLQATRAISIVSKKSKCTHWFSGSKEPSKQSISTHHSWRQWFCQQLLFSSLFSKISPIFSPRLCSISHFRVPQSSQGNHILITYFRVFLALLFISYITNCKKFEITRYLIIY